MRHILAAASLLVLAACGLQGTDREGADSDSSAATAPDANLADTMASRDAAEGEDVTPQIPDSEKRPEMQLQVVLDRQGFGPGVIDGAMGTSTKNALRGFQEANDLEITGELDDATTTVLARWDNIPATRVVRIPEAWRSLSFTEVPEDPAEQAERPSLGYESLDERLAERFHTTIEVLETLNPGGRPAGSTQAGASSQAIEEPAMAGEEDRPRSIFSPGQLVRVPNLGADRIAEGSVSDADWRRTLQMLGVGSEQPEVERIVVSKSKGTLKAYDASDRLVALFTVTTGSQHDPLPIGDWAVKGVAYNPPFSYDPDLFWDAPDTDEEEELPPGPNGPVGVVWIDLTKEHYGIHGTPEPQAIGRSQSHGCVRLTNWDAARLAQMVSGGTHVVFEA